MVATEGAGCGATVTLGNERWQLPPTAAFPACPNTVPVFRLSPPHMQQLWEYFYYYVSGSSSYYYNSWSTCYMQEPNQSACVGAGPGQGSVMHSQHSLLACCLPSAGFAACSFVLRQALHCITAGNSIAVC